MYDNVIISAIRMHKICTPCKYTYHRYVFCACELHIICGWLGRAMVLGIFQCRGVLLLWCIIGQGPVVLAAGAG